MTLILATPEDSLRQAANWEVLEYLVDRFNRERLEGEILLSRTGVMKDLQLQFTGTSCGRSYVVLSESFPDNLLTENSRNMELAQCVSRFLLRIKQEHEANCAAPEAGQGHQS